MAYSEVGLCSGQWVSNPHCLVHAQHSSLIPIKKETLTDVLYYSLNEDWTLVKVILSKFMLLFKWQGQDLNQSRTPKFLCLATMLFYLLEKTELRVRP